jgi:hypothetical protein
LSRPAVTPVSSNRATADSRHIHSPARQWRPWEETFVSLHGSAARKGALSTVLAVLSVSASVAVHAQPGAASSGTATGSDGGRQGSARSASTDPFATRGAHALERSDQQQPIQLAPRLSHMQRRAIDNCNLLEAAQQDACRAIVMSTVR